MGPGTVVDFDTGRTAQPARFGVGVILGCHCVVERGAVLGNRVQLDHFCRVGAGSELGADTRLLYGAQVFEDASIGERCVIGGPVDDRTVIESDVTYMGSMAHSYRTPGTLEDWDTVEQPSPVIRRGAVIGQNALLIGPVEIGPGAYVAAGEIVRSNVPANTVLMRGERRPIEDFRGMVTARLRADH